MRGQKLRRTSTFNFQHIVGPLRGIAPVIFSCCTLSNAFSHLDIYLAYCRLQISRHPRFRNLVTTFTRWPSIWSNCASHSKTIVFGCKPYTFLLIELFQSATLLMRMLWLVQCKLPVLMKQTKSKSVSLSFLRIFPVSVNEFKLFDHCVSLLRSFRV